MNSLSTPQQTSTSPPAVPRSPAPRRFRWLPAVALLAVVLLWGVAVNHLMRAPKTDVKDMEVAVRSNAVLAQVLPEHIRMWRSSQFDLIAHFVCFIPFGLAVGAAGYLGGCWMGERGERIAFWSSAVMVFAWAAYDELMQANVPTRSATVGDLASTCAGILVGITLWFLGRALYRRIRRRSAKRMESPLPT